MNKIKVILVLLGITLVANLFSQEKKKWVYSLDEALKNPHTTKYLILNNKGYETLPREILLLTDLIELNLSMNKNLKSIPNEICKLQKLRKLSLAYCNLSTLPDSIVRLKKLKKLILLENNFTIFPIQVCQLEQLEVLNLTVNKIEEIPEQIKNLSNLKDLGLGGNRLTKREIIKLKELLPDCDIGYGGQFID